MIKINKKGFTLVEVLTTIVIISLVLVVSFYGITKIKDIVDSKNKYISLNGIKKSASIYATESSSSEWRKEEKEGQDTFEYFCLTIGELMNKGYIKKDSLLPDGYTKESYLFVKRNLLTKDIVGEYKPEEYNSSYNICNNNLVISGDVINKNPSFKKNNSYTDKLVIEFNKGSSIFNDIDSVKDYSCYYGKTLNSVNNDSNVTIEGNKCIINGLQNNTDYYVYIYMNTTNGSHILASGKKNFRTTDFNNTVIRQESNQVIDIKYNVKDNNKKTIAPVYRYFKSNVSSTSSVNVKKCDNHFNCNYDTNIIEKDIWYLSPMDNIKLNYALPKVDTEVIVNTKLMDGSNNYRDNIFQFTILSDVTPPEIEIINIVDGQNVNSDKWYNKDVTLNIMFKDNQNGVGVNPNSLQISLDNKNFSFIQNASDSKYVDIKRDEQDSNIYYKICDYVNNCSTGKTRVRIDKTVPSISINNSSGGNWINKDVTVSLNYDDKLSGINVSTLKYKDNNSNYSPVKNSNDYVWTNEGQRTIYYNICDNAGNCATTNSNIKIDKTSPELTINNSSNQKWTNKNIKISLNYKDSLSGINTNSIKYSTDNGNTYYSVTTENDYTWSAEGDIIGYYKVCDIAGNCTSSSTKIRIDKTPPKYTFNLSSGSKVNKYDLITASCVDKISSVTKSPEVTAGSSSNINYSCIDEAGNITRIYGQSNCILNCIKTRPVPRWRYTHTITHKNGISETITKEGFLSEDAASSTCRSEQISSGGGNISQCAVSKYKAGLNYVSDDCDLSSNPYCTNDYIFTIK